MQTFAPDAVRLAGIMISFQNHMVSVGELPSRYLIRELRSSLLTDG